ncbi:MAG: Omp28-related outer membrane protein [Bacteroidetes bacterium]|nr:Omp28-related outer membrane protein [Bacteroidota bacterium]
MKTFFNISLSFLCGSLLLCSCTKIDEPYSTVKPVIIDTTTRSVLLEDYTGHICVNCAPGATMANTLQDLYHGQVYVIAVHAGFYAMPQTDTTQNEIKKYYPYLIGDYRCPTGNDWNNYADFKIEQNPSGMVNRRLWKGNPSFIPSEWYSAIQVAVVLPKVAIMSMNNLYNAQTKSLTSNVYVKFLVSYTGPVSLTVCMIEDSIYGGQLNNIKPDSTPIIKNFRFMHVLRGSLISGESFGSQIANNPIPSDYVAKSYPFDFSDKSWIPKHCSVIAFISDANTKEVLHVIKSPVIK